MPEPSPLRLKLCQAGEPVLRGNAQMLAPADVNTPEIQNLIEMMRETMRDAPGVGLAAPQVGVPLQLAVIEDRGELHKSLTREQLAERDRLPVPFHVIINPVLTVEEEQAIFFEGCLSVAGFGALVPRSLQVRVECLDHRGQPCTIEAHGWYARILQHEIDHLHGTLYVDRMISRSFMTVDNYVRNWGSRPGIEIARAFAPNHAKSLAR